MCVESRWLIGNRPFNIPAFSCGYCECQSALISSRPQTVLLWTAKHNPEQILTNMQRQLRLTSQMTHSKTLNPKAQIPKNPSHGTFGAFGSGLGSL